ncbi:hybrid sensor histidine kinase/response regulator [Aliterella atlantica]|uniref:Circadian input-output histidine kinase CikA n=1 Tax=Aliterella atlantica CENA595 TaxID=1618023 RepID=A0A0D8ZUL6_9CYAN|nr:response regulator [Aliterella atlantica]KJH72415.1 chemotaxis protein CheY [Aliterella atlantica CENA595]
MDFQEQVNILIVDDRPENLLALEAILDNLKANLVRANSGEQALRCLLNQDFAVILLDVQMPGIDGFETATLIRQRERSRHTPIIFLTAFSKSDELRSKGYATGAVDYLLKPIQPEILISKVAVFIELFRKTAKIERQAAQLKLANAELRKSEQRFRCLSASSPIGIFLTDVAGNCTYTNPRCQTICGLALEGNLQQNLLAIVHPKDCDRVLTDWLICLEGKRECVSEFRLQIPQHTGICDRTVNLRSSPMLSEQGVVIGYVGTVEDITQRKQSEDRRVQLLHAQVAKQQAEEANQMKDDFLATLSHELRTPLNSILGWSRLLRTREFDSNTTNRALETIERNAKMQAQLIEDILDVSRIIRGKLNLVLRPVQLQTAIATAIDTVRLAAEAKNIHIKTIVDTANNHTPSSAILVAGDSDRLQQVLWNLLNNAIKFTPSGGKVEVQLSTAGAYAEIKVIDSGIGINPEFLPCIFERFRQADSTTTRAYGGLGLGLAIVRHLVEQHGGTVDASSLGTDKGSTFTVKLPLVQAKKQLVAPKKDNLAASTSLENLQILVVDDEIDVRELLSVVLTEYGAQVVAAGSAREAMQVLEQLQPDVLISDIEMPNEDGYTFLAKVRQLEARGRQIPAVALTAYARQEDCAEALSSGFQMHISKPVDTNKLIVAVAKLARHTQEVGSKVDVV